MLYLPQREWRSRCTAGIFTCLDGEETDNEEQDDEDDDHENKTNVRAGWPERTYPHLKIKRH